MKRMIFYVFSLILTVLFVYIVLKNREVPPGLLLSLNTYYSLIEDEEIMEVPIYVNQLKHPITKESSYLSLSLTNKSKSKSIDVNLMDVLFIEETQYLNQTFYAHIIRLDLPYLGSDYFISDLYLEITLNNLETFHIEIGRLSIYYPSSNQKYLDWSSLSGLKEETSIISRLKYIHIDFITLDNDIEKIEIGIQLETHFELEIDKLIITIPDEFYLLSKVPIIITFKNQDIQIIESFLYFNEYHILNKNGILVNTYALN